MKPKELKKEALSNFSGKFLKLLSMQFIYLLIVFAIIIVCLPISGLERHTLWKYLKMKSRSGKERS